MSPDPERCAEAREWLVRAQHDLLAAPALLGTTPTLSDVAVYHCQQAAEKALKAPLFWHDTPFRKTHDLEELGVQCVALDAGLDSLLDKTSALTPYAGSSGIPVPLPNRQPARPPRRSSLPRTSSTPWSSDCHPRSTRNPGSERRPLGVLLYSWGQAQAVGCFSRFSQAGGFGSPAKSAATQPSEVRFPGASPPPAACRLRR